MLFALGGTISLAAGADGHGATFSLGAVDLLAHLGANTELQVRPVTFRQIPSADLEVESVVELAEAIDEVAQAGAAGVVVTQGTDTLEESAYLLDLLLRTDVPVVVTGAMRSPSLPGADGPANLDAAVRTASSPLARDLGVLVVFGDEIHLARFVHKRHSSAPSAFTSGLAGPIGWINEGRVRIPLVPRHRTQPIIVPHGSELPRVALLQSVLGDSDALLSAVATGGYAGLVLEAFGAGHVSRRSANAVKDLAARIPVVFSSRTGAGEVFTASADYPGSERDLLAGGLIPAGALDGLKARAMLQLLLAAGADRAEITNRYAATVQ